jgi:hypothetical protein
MDNFSYMSTYTQALENASSMYEGTEAAESFKKDAMGLIKAYQSQLNELYAQMQAAFSSGQYEVALARANDLEQLIIKWKAELRDIPPDSNFTKAVALTCAIISIVVSVAMWFKAPDLLMPVVKLLKKMGVSQAFLGSADFQKAFIRSAKLVSFVGSSMTLDKIFSAIFGAVLRPDAATRNRYKDDPNYKATGYVKMQSNLDDSLRIVRAAKEEIEKAMNKG